MMKKETLIKLAEALKKKRTELNLSLRDVQDETGLSASTISRIEHCNGSPDADSLRRLAEWLEIPLDSLMNDKEGNKTPVTAFLDRSMPEIVREHLMRDQNLTPENAERLAEIFSVSYAQYASYSKGE